MDTQPNEFPMYLDTFQINYFLPKLLESYDIIVPWWGPKPKQYMLRFLNMVHFHTMLRLRARWLQMGFIFPTVRPLANFQGPSDFHRHDFWSVC